MGHLRNMTKTDGQRELFLAKTNHSQHVRLTRPIDFSLRLQGQAKSGIRLLDV